MSTGRTTALALLLLLTAGGCSSDSSSEKKGSDSTNLDQEKESIARAQAMTIATACDVYHKNNGTQPASLEDLTKNQPSGGKPLVQPDAIIDPWGKVFQYDASGPMNGGDKVDVWTTTPGGKKIGNWPSKKD
jgi:hypothetical protein